MSRSGFDVSDIAAGLPSTLLDAQYSRIRELTEHPKWITALGELTLANLSGWVAPQWDAAQAAQHAEASRARAIAAGASV